MIAHLVSRVANDGQERARIGSLQPAYAIQQLPLSSVLWQLELRRRLADAVDRSDGRRIAAGFLSVGVEELQHIPSTSQASDIELAWPRLVATSRGPCRVLAPRQ